MSQSIELGSVLRFVKRFSRLLGPIQEPIMIVVVMIERRAVPLWAWPVIAAAIAYLLNPLDAMPDPIFIDDAGVLAAAIAILRPAITEEIRAEARRRVQTLRLQ